MKDIDCTIKLTSKNDLLEIIDGTAKSMQHMWQVESERKVRQRAAFKCAKSFKNYYDNYHIK